MAEYLSWSVGSRPTTTSYQKITTNSGAVWSIVVAFVRKFHIARSRTTECFWNSVFSEFRILSHITIIHDCLLSQFNHNWNYGKITIHFYSIFRSMWYWPIIQKCKQQQLINCNSTKLMQKFIKKSMIVDHLRVSYCNECFALWLYRNKIVILWCL